MAIMYPLRKKNTGNFRSWNVTKTHVIIGIWLVGIAISMPDYLMFRTMKFCYNDNYYYECRSIWPEYFADQYTTL